jgi:NAD(P)-dependent dehydrogenase (short-subunit alcohol dehydrogenase family)
MSVFALDGKTAVVTGGGAGLGKGIARCLAEVGARVVITGRRPDVLEQARSEIGGHVEAEVLDVTDGPAVVDFAARIGSVDILVSNAGNHVRRPAEEMSDEEFASVIDVHLHGGFSVARELGARMLRGGGGSIVYVGSMNAVIGMPQVAAYSAAKAGLHGLVRALAVEWADRGVRVNAVVPGWVDAGMAQRVLTQDDERMARVLARTPMHRLGTVEDIGWAVTYLCSPAASFVTGVALHVDGGAAIGF